MRADSFDVFFRRVEHRLQHIACPRPTQCMHACRPHLHPPSLPSGGLLASTAQHLLEPDAPAAMRDADRICSQAGSGAARGDKRLSARRKMRPRDVRALERAGHALFRAGRGAGRSPMAPRTEAARPRTRGFRHLVHVGRDGHRQGGKPRHKLHRGGRRVCWDRLTRLAPATGP